MATSVNETSNITASASLGATADYAGYVFVPMFLFMGVVGNALTIRIMLTKGFRTMPVSKVLIALSVSDLIVNILFPFNKPFVRQIMDTDIRAVSNAGCKFFFWAYRNFKFTSSWMVVLISTERFVAVWLHVRAKSINTTRNAYIAIAVLFAVVTVYVGYWSAFSDQIINGKCIPNTSPPGKGHITRALLVFGVVAMYVVVPAVLLIIFNGLIVFKLISLRKKKMIHVMPATGSVKKTQTTERKDRTRAPRPTPCLSASPQLSFFWKLLLVCCTSRPSSSRNLSSKQRMWGC